MREFHDATIDVFTTKGSDLLLEMEDVGVYEEAAVPDGTHETGTFTIFGVKRLLENGEEVTAPTCAFSYGRILDLTVTEDGVVLLVEWQFADPSISRFAEYKIYGEGTSWVPSASFPPE